MANLSASSVVHTVFFLEMHPPQARESLLQKNLAGFREAGKCQNHRQMRRKYFHILSFPLLFMGDELYLDLIGFPPVMRAKTDTLELLEVTDQFVIEIGVP